MVIISLGALADTGATPEQTVEKQVEKATQAKKVKKSKKGNCDAFIGLPKTTWVLATGKKRVYVRSKASSKG